jgi:hypothetical protein
MINFDTWNQLLSQYVDSKGRVDYGPWKSESSTHPKSMAWRHQASRYTSINSDQELAYGLISITPLLLLQF